MLKRIQGRAGSVTAGIGAFASILGIYAFFFMEDPSVKLLEDSIPKWLDISLGASISTPTALQTNTKVRTGISFRITNPTNAPIRVLSVVAESEKNGRFQHEEQGYVIPARGYKGFVFYGDFHRETTICVIGQIQDNTFIRELRSLEMTGDAEDQLGVLMGMLTLNVKLLDQEFTASRKPLGCVPLNS